jgi:general secretion pathway protein H
LRNKGQAGFTLIEVLVVLVVLGIAAALLAMHGPQRSPGLDLRTASEEVAGTLRLARTRAIAGNRVVGVTFDVAARSVKLDGTAARTLPPGVGIVVTATLGGTVGGGTVGDEAADDETPSKAVGGRLAAIRFAPDGSSTGGRVELLGRGRRVEVGVNWLTGRVAVSSLVADGA